MMNNLPKITIQLCSFWSLTAHWCKFTPKASASCSSSLSPGSSGWSCCYSHRGGCERGGAKPSTHPWEGRVGWKCWGMK